MKSVEESLLHMAKQSGKADENVVRCVFVCVCVHHVHLCMYSTRGLLINVFTSTS